MTKVRLARIARLITRIAEIAFGHDPKHADGRQGPAVIAVELVSVIAIHHDLPFESARELEPLHERLSRIEVSFASVTVAVTNAVAVVKVVLFAVRSWRTTQLSPRHLNVADVIVTVTGIEIEHGVSRRWRTIA